MATGYWIVEDDRTSCGGMVLEVSPYGRKFGTPLKRQALQGDKVSCGKHPGKYIIAGGHPGDIMHGILSASTLYSRSTCPCNASFIPSQTFASHGPYQDDTTHRPALKQQYTVTIYLAYPGTPLNENDGTPKIDNETGLRVVSAAGHMWYRISKLPDTGKDSLSYGFAPIKSGVTGRGFVSKYDTVNYENPYYRRTLEITEAQYNKLHEFGKTAIDNSEIYFSLDYNGITNSCIDFTWQALHHAGLKPYIFQGTPLEKFLKDRGKNFQFDGTVSVGSNQMYVRAISAPFPDSTLNQEIKNPAPQQGFIQKTISGFDLDNYDKLIR